MTNAYNFFPLGDSRHYCYTSLSFLFSRWQKTLFIGVCLLVGRKAGISEISDGTKSYEIAISDQNCLALPHTSPARPHHGPCPPACDYLLAVHLALLFHADDWRGYPFHWAGYAFAKIPFCEEVKETVINKLADMTFMEELVEDLHCLFSLDRDFT